MVVDQTGVGRALVDMLRQRLQAHIVPVTITAGSKATRQPDGSYHVPKKDLVTCLQLLLQKRRLKICETLPEAAALVKELESFRLKVTAAAHETFGAGGESQHDDLVLAAALACWWAENQAWSGPDSCTAGGRMWAADLFPPQEERPRSDYGLIVPDPYDPNNIDYS